TDGAAGNAQDRGPDARHPRVVVSGDRRRAAPARRHRQVAHQPRTHRARSADQEAARRRLQPQRAFTEAHGSLLMNVKTDQSGGVSIVRVGETRLMYPILGDFTAAVSALVAAGKHDIVIHLSPVTYVDSATIGWLMDL